MWKHCKFVLPVLIAIHRAAGGLGKIIFENNFTRSNHYNTYNYSPLLATHRSFLTLLYIFDSIMDDLVEYEEPKGKPGQAQGDNYEAFRIPEPGREDPFGGDTPLSSRFSPTRSLGFDLHRPGSVHARSVRSLSRFPGQGPSPIRGETVPEARHLFSSRGPEEASSLVPGRATSQAPLRAVRDADFPLPSIETMASQRHNIEVREFPIARAAKDLP